MSCNQSYEDSQKGVITLNGERYYPAKFVESREKKGIRIVPNQIMKCLLEDLDEIDDWILKTAKPGCSEKSNMIYYIKERLVPVEVK